MISWIKRLGKPKPKVEVVTRKVAVNMCQLTAHIGMQSYKYGDSYEYWGDPLRCINSYRGDVFSNFGIIPYHKIDRIEAKVWKEEREETVFVIGGKEVKRA